MTELTDYESGLVQLIADTSRGFGVETETPATVPLEVVLRVAEKCYRRGVQQGATYMREQLYPRHSGYPWPGTPDTAPGKSYLTAIDDWRGRGAAGNYADGELPPQPFTRRRGQR